MIPWQKGCGQVAHGMVHAASLESAPELAAVLSNPMLLCNPRRYKGRQWMPMEMHALCWRRRVTVNGRAKAKVNYTAAPAVA